MSSPRMELGFSLGSNLGDKVENLRLAAREILAMEDAELVGKSSLFETEPVDVKPEYQHLKFLNSVLVISTAVPAETWLERIGELETRMGRERDQGDKNAPRQLDVDIIFAGDRLIGSGGLTVPHPRWAERRFVVQPLSEIHPDRVLPGMTKSVSEILAALPGEAELTKLEESW